MYSLISSWRYALLETIKFDASTYCPLLTALKVNVAISPPVVALATANVWPWGTCKDCPCGTWTVLVPAVPDWLPDNWLIPTATPLPEDSN